MFRWIICILVFLSLSGLFASAAIRHQGDEHATLRQQQAVYRHQQQQQHKESHPAAASTTAAASKVNDASYTPLMAYFEDTLLRPIPLYQAHTLIENFHTNGGYDTEMSNSINNALTYVQSQTAQNNSAWVFDIDETSLSGYTEMLSIGFGYVTKLNHEWILNSSAPAIPQTLNLYKTVVNQGFKVIFLTGRHADEYEATAQNLVNAGYTYFDQLIVRSPAEANMTAAEYKSGRRVDLVQNQGYNIVGCVGDQWSDLHGPYTGIKVKLPNYIYFLP